jgi:hypothetical protein
MTPDAAVDGLVEILESRSTFSEDEVYAEMDAAGIPYAEADRAFKFTQIASGRVLLTGIVGRFCDDYFGLDAGGEVVESGRLGDNPFFVAATAVIRQRPGPWVGQLGAMSADVGAVNDLLNSGSKPGKLKTGPAVLFYEVPTASGMQKADRLIGEYLRAAAPARPAKWWRFW